MPAEQQFDEQDHQQGIEQRVAEARQRFRGELRRLLRERLGDEVAADVERRCKMDAGLEQILATYSVEEIELVSRLLSDVSLVEPPRD